MSNTVLSSLDAWSIYGHPMDDRQGRVLPPFWDDALAMACGGPTWRAVGQEYLLRRMMREVTLFTTDRVFRALLTEGEHSVVGRVQEPQKGATRADRQRFKRSEEALAFTQAWVDRLEYPLRSVCWDLGEAFAFGSKLCEVEVDVFPIDAAPFKGGTYVAPVDLSPKPRTVYQFEVDNANRVKGVRPDGSASTPMVPAANLLWLSVGGMDRNPVGEPILAACWKAYHRKMEALDDESKTGKQSGFIVVNQEYAPKEFQGDTGYITVRYGDGTERLVSKLVVAADAMKAARRGMTAALPPGMTATMLQAGTFDFGSILDRCDREIVAAFLGAARALKEAQNGSKADTGEATGVAETMRDWARGLLSASIERLFATVLRLNFGDKYADVVPTYDIVTEEGEDLAAIGNFFVGNFDRLTLEQKNFLASKIGMPAFPEEDEAPEAQPTDTQDENAIAANDQAATEADVSAFAATFSAVDRLTFATRLEIANGAAQKRVGGSRGAVRSADRQFRSLVTRLQKGSLTEQEFKDRFSHTLQVAHERAYQIGFAHAGGGSVLTDKGDEYVASTVASEGEFLADLASNVADGTVSLKQGLLSARRYAKRVRGTANEGFRDGCQVTGDKIYWDTNGAVERHCVECPRYAAMSPWEPDELPTTPGAGDTPCFQGCACGLRSESGRQGFQPVDFST